ncbi:trimeric intracellular cation channel family protein [Campylobacter fetus]|nr:trimeric intracellular cation channel family protein [Campylobacter fetus]EAI5946146.1 trimeric intracellular cation channel family protein [Campylobacter fetus]EAJ0318814.1 trimeric intracellular cation channel family protein [Campylobacter fetus]EAJ0345268.1 trimeric intracellular cation channel family protein [Campylobacter fetus]EAJ1238161.1 trimeric intracellular cation channel family protein [Campylobacter fetus]
MEAFLLAEYIGIASAALSGFLFGIKRGCDWLGVFLAAFLTALGGGLMRDVIVGRPAYSFTHHMPVLIVIGVMFIAIFLKFHRENRNDLEKKFIFIMTDAVDVISFSIVGAIVSLEYGLNVFGVVMVAFCNGVGGGILRDVLLNEVPWFLKTGLYGTISMSIGLIYYFMSLYGLTNIYWIMALFALGVIFRLCAYYRKWNLPQIHYKE